MQRYWITLCFIVFIITFGVTFPTQSLGVKSDAMMLLPLVFASVLIVCLFLERAIEVFLSALRGGGADQLDAQIERYRNVINAVGNNEKPTATLLEELLETRSQYRSHSRLIAQQMGLCIGLVIALVGFRILENLVLDTPSGWQGRVFTVVDVLLTGCVLAGGSDAVNKLTKAYSKLMASIGGKSS